MSQGLWYWSGALLNMALVVGCLWCGVRAVRRPEVARHRRFMLTAVALVGLFIVSYGLKLTLLGREETGELEPAGAALLQLLHLVAKLVTARQAVAGASEILESFGGAGYVEDTGLPELLRDCQVYPIWEGTTNVLALECFRAVQRADALAPFVEEIRTRASVATHPALLEPAGAACNAGQRAREWWSAGATRGPVASEAGARRFAFTLGRSLALALLVEQAQWAIDRDADGRSAEAARRFAAAGVDFLDNPEVEPGARNALALEDPHRLKS